MDQRKFRNVAGTFATGVTILTTKDEKDVPVGMTANSFTSLSISPPLVLINVGKNASLYHAFINASCFGVNILSAEQKELSKLFSTKNIDRFTGVDFEEDVTGAPILKNILGYFDCTVKYLYDGGDHTIIVGEVQSGHEREGQPLLFYKGQYVNLASNIVQ